MISDRISVIQSHTHSACDIDFYVVGLESHTKTQDNSMRCENMK